eukprot:GHVL01037129.1.p1 GENE.GHVL01037129.1~~GHVL01037129.1.p1  ORF type:complete len:137 (-),score=16.07 GHVL01037129.1:43-453(-)
MFNSRSFRILNKYKYFQNIQFCTKNTEKIKTYQNPIKIIINENTEKFKINENPEKQRYENPPYIVVPGAIIMIIMCVLAKQYYDHKKKMNFIELWTGYVKLLTACVTLIGIAGAVFGFPLIVGCFSVVLLISWIRS